jgi:hypothetical protein
MMYRVVTLTILGKIRDEVYESDNFEACKLAADRVSIGTIRKVVVIDTARNWLYAAN